MIYRKRLLQALFSSIFILSLVVLFETVRAAEVTIDSNTVTVATGDYPFDTIECGGATEYLALSGYDLSAISTACLVKHSSVWEWSTTGEGTGIIRAAVFETATLGGAPNLTKQIGDWTTPVDITTFDLTHTITDFLWANKPVVSGKYISIVYEMQVDICGTDILDVSRDNGPEFPFQMWRKKEGLAWDDTSTVNRTWRDSSLVYENSAAICNPTPGAFIDLSTDPIWIAKGSTILEDEFGAALANLSNICWQWYDNLSMLQSSSFKDGAVCDASTDISGNLSIIPINTSFNAGDTGILLIELGDRLTGYRMTIQE